MGSSSNDSRNKDDLLGCLVECLDALSRLAWIKFESGGSFRALLRKDALRFADGGQGFGIAHLRFLVVPGQAVVAAP
jgi:hypothetical protein